MEASGVAGIEKTRFFCLVDVLLVSDLRSPGNMNQQTRNATLEYGGRVVFCPPPKLSEANHGATNCIGVNRVVAYLLSFYLPFLEICT